MTINFAAAHANTDTLSGDESHGIDDWFHIPVITLESEPHELNNMHFMTS